MNVLHVMNQLCFSGAEIMYVDASVEFKKLGCNLFVINAHPVIGPFADSFRKAGFKVLHFPYPKNPIKKLRYYYDLAKFVKEHNIDVIHTHHSGMKWSMALVAKLCGIKSVYTVHNNFRSRRITWPYQFWLRWSASHLLGCRFQSISDSVHDNELNYYHNKTTKVYNWYGNQRFYPAEKGEKSMIREELGISDNSLVLISIGGCSEVKRHHHILKSLPRIISDCPDTVYIHLGEGRTLNEEMELAKSLGVDNHVRFLGNRTDVRKYLIASDIYIMPSRFEGISITAIETLACGIPEILYDVPGLRDFNFDKECALVIPPDEENIPKAIKSLLNDRDMMNRHIKNGLEMVHTKYYLPDNIQQIYKLYVD